MEIKAWNRARLYSVHGQRMAATRLEDGRCAFVDIDRGISGVTLGRIADAYSLGPFVEDMYDWGQYGYLDYTEFPGVEKALRVAAEQVVSLAALGTSGG